MPLLSPFTGKAGFILEMSRGRGLGTFLFVWWLQSVCLSVYQSPCRCQYRTRWRSLSPAQIKITSDFYFIEQSCFIEQMADGVLSVEVIVSLDLGD